MKTFEDIQKRIRSRIYSSPSRARAAVTRSSVTNRQKARLTELCDVWESEMTNGATVGGPPAEAAQAHEAELVESSAVEVFVPLAAARPPSERAFSVNLNARVRARLNAHGIAVLYGSRQSVIIPPDLITNQGVWETELWEFMRVMGPAFDLGSDPVTADNRLDILEPR